MADPKPQVPTVVDTPVIINEDLTLNIKIKAVITYEQVPPPKP
ncbi:MAG: hypothetical protein RL214_848 [Pseudomonadota bacterium]|jgi:hypothetical protein